jgi:1,4-dihydroxy-2-naphthoate octaprenyltransferase
VIANWLEALQTTNFKEGVEPDVVSKWLVITRASVIPMTFFSACIGGLLAVPSGHASLGLWALCALGLVIAHATNNMVNDYYDTESGVDTPDYARAQYAPHPLLSGMITKRGLLTAIAIANVIDVAIALVLTYYRGWPVAAFAISGFAISLFYVAPPLQLKHRGLGEPSVFVVWGPLMIAGTYFVTTGTLPGWVWWASIPYGLLVMTVLFGKHIDKYDADKGKNIHTLPVLMGTDSARLATQLMIVGFYGVVLWQVGTGVLGVWTLAVLLSLPRAWQILQIFGNPRPSEPPPNYPVWPLWYVAAAFSLTRLTGALFAAGLLVNAFIPWYLSA